MSKLTILALWGFSVVAMFSGCKTENEQDIDSASLIGANIYEVSRDLKEQGFKVSEIDDPTGEGYLFMTVRIDDISKLDSFFYALGEDPRPWGKNKPSHLWIEASTNGVINKVEAK